MKKKIFSNTTISRFLTLLSVIYLVILSSICLLASYYSYQQKKNSIIEKMDTTMSLLVQEYHYITNDFWKLYMPIFENKQTTYNTIKNYFSTNTHSTMSPMKKKSLKIALSQIMNRNTAVQWVALYSEDADVNYIYFEGCNSVKEIPKDFPYLKDLEEQTEVISIYRKESLVNEGSVFQTFAISGGTPLGMGKGKIIVGFRNSSFDRYYSQIKESIPFTNFYIACTNGLIYDSTNQYNNSNFLFETCYEDSKESNNSSQQSNSISSNKAYYKNSYSSPAKGYAIYYEAPWNNILLNSHTNTPYIIVALILFIFLYVFLYSIIYRYAFKKIVKIKDGLHMISVNNLNYRIDIDDSIDELSEIACSINNMTERLQENINRTYYHKIKAKEAELSELQSKFNPHFLYNTLEMIRSKSYQNGDYETAKIIVDLSTIFRGLISPKTFIPIKQELAFCNHYLSLFKYRYEDNVQILFDFDSNLLNYGILRNILQPIIENYFLHGINPNEPDNYLLFRGKTDANENILIEVEDNGLGMTNQQMDDLNNKLSEPITLESDSYGLKNIHQRLQLFYGKDCGLSIIRNTKKGIIVKLLISKMTMEEYNRL